MVAKLDEDEEESSLRRNPTLVTLFEVDVVGIVKRYTKGVKEVDTNKAKGPLRTKAKLKDRDK